MSTIRVMHPEFSESKLVFIENYKFDGKTIDEWETELEHCSGLNSEGKPIWYDVMNRLTDATAMAEVMYDSQRNNSGC
jgi:hypothetical protein